MDCGELPTFARVDLQGVCLTPFIDNLTAYMVAIAYAVMGTAMVVQSRTSAKAPGWIITGLSAYMVTGIYVAPLYGVPVVELRAALRLALFVHAVNYSILHYKNLAELLEVLTRYGKTLWRSHRS